jgi:hypothetical protein
MQALDKPELDEDTGFTSEPPAFSSTFGNATSTAVQFTMQALDKLEFDEGTVFTATEPPPYSIAFGNATSTAVPQLPRRRA